MCRLDAGEIGGGGRGREGWRERRTNEKTEGWREEGRKRPGLHTWGVNLSLIGRAKNKQARRSVLSAASHRQMREDKHTAPRISANIYRI